MPSPSEGEEKRRGDMPGRPSSRRSSSPCRPWEGGREEAKEGPELALLLSSNCPSVQKIQEVVRTSMQKIDKDQRETN